jgi:ABC-type transporter Mla MlaB component
MFILEAIKAKHGDCLLLHWGTDDDPGLALIDGGPNRVYAEFLKPRLEELASQRGQNPLKLDLTMVSHIDEDHIAGLLDLAEEIENQDASVRIDLLWHNSLEGLLDEKIQGPSSNVTAAVGSRFPGLQDSHSPWMQKVLASVPQGQELHAFAKRMGIYDTMNAPYHPLIIADPRERAADIKGLQITVVCPASAEVEKLRKQWVKLRREGITADYTDRSPYNLSSLVVIVEYEKKRMLLTGDARGDLILQGLRQRNLLRNDNDTIHFDLLKLPHHGSSNNVEEDFFRRITADTYVVSGDYVRFLNPNEDAMRWLAKARDGADYTVCCTYDLPHMRSIFGNKLRVPDGNNSSVKAEIVTEGEAPTTVPPAADTSAGFRRKSDKSAKAAASKRAKAAASKRAKATASKRAKSKSKRAPNRPPRGKQQ